MPIRLSRSLAILAPVLLAAAAPAAALEVGTAAAVNSDTFGTPPASDTRLIFLGTELLFEERLETGTTGTTQALFLDKSTVTIGPDSELLIDRFVYDPQSGTGETVLSFTRGVMRFVGGQISKAEGGVTVRTPTATVGIRGGIGILRQDDEGTRVIFIAGDEMSISSGDTPGIKITRPGGSATVAPGGGIEDTGVASSEEIAEANGATQGNGGGGLADGEGPTDGAARQALGSGLAGDDRTLGAPPVSVGSTRRPTQSDFARADVSLIGEVADATQELATLSLANQSPGEKPDDLGGGADGGNLPITPGPVTPGPVTPGPVAPGPATPGPVAPVPSIPVPSIPVPSARLRPPSAAAFSLRRPRDTPTASARPSPIPLRASCSAARPRGTTSRSPPMSRAAAGSAAAGRADSRCRSATVPSR